MAHPLSKPPCKYLGYRDVPPHLAQAVSQPCLHGHIVWMRTAFSIYKLLSSWMLGFHGCLSPHLRDNWPLRFWLLNWSFQEEGHHFVVAWTLWRTLRFFHNLLCYTAAILRTHIPSRGPGGWKMRQRQPGSLCAQLRLHPFWPGHVQHFLDVRKHMLFAEHGSTQGSREEN